MDEASFRISDLPPGTTIEFADITEVVAFEDQLAREIDPFMGGIAGAAWTGRVALSELVRPAKFNGRIGEIALAVLAEPYQMLIGANERGVKLTRGFSRQYALNSDLAPEEIPRYKGYAFTANAFSSGRGKIGQIQAELYYYPAPLKQVKDRYFSRVSPDGRSVIRVVTKPIMTNDEAFTELDATSRRMAYQVLSDNLRRPIRQPFHN